MQLLTRLKANDFIRHNGIFFFGSLAVAALNYLYYPVLGRLLPTEKFGEVQTLVSLFLQINIFLGVVTNVAVNVVANETDIIKRNNITAEFERLATLVTIVIAVIGLIFLAQVRVFLRFDANLPFLILALSMIMSAPLALQTAYLRGRSAFGALSVNSIVGSTGKLIASIIFVLLGYGTAGAIGGLVAGQLVAVFLARRQTRKLGYSKAAGSPWRLPDLSLIKPELPYAALVLIVSVVTTFQFSFDILVIKHYFTPQTAGLYGGIATIGRIIYFLTGSFAVVLLSQVKRSAPLNENRRLLLRSAGFQALIGGTVLLVFILAPRLVIGLLLGTRYLPMAGLLPELSITLFIVAFISLILNFDMALRRWSAAVIAVLGGAITLTLVLLSHATPTAVVTMFLLGSSIMLILRGLDSLRRRILAKMQLPPRISPRRLS